MNGRKIRINERYESLNVLVFSILSFKQTIASSCFDKLSLNKFLTRRFTSFIEVKRKCIIK